MKKRIKLAIKNTYLCTKVWDSLAKKFLVREDANKRRLVLGDHIWLLQGSLSQVKILLLLVLSAMRLSRLLFSEFEQGLQ
mmetsp:Transcript_57340/g.48462  ORF Transcript_57340/g.48462 Transcript_57340/m.48462 type:complete len:80 (+) Transcript_57340:506-745(+)